MDHSALHNKLRNDWERPNSEDLVDADSMPTLRKANAPPLIEQVRGEQVKHKPCDMDGIQIACRTHDYKLMAECERDDALEKVRQLHSLNRRMKKALKVIASNDWDLTYCVLKARAAIAPSPSKGGQVAVGNDQFSLQRKFVKIVKIVDCVTESKVQLIQLPKPQFPTWDNYVRKEANYGHEH